MALTIIIALKTVFTIGNHVIAVHCLKLKGYVYVQCTYVIDIPQGPLQYYVRICGDYRRVTGYMGGY